MAINEMRSTGDVHVAHIMEEEVVLAMLAGADAVEEVDTEASAEVAVVVSMVVGRSAIRGISWQ